jgi:hypothetical protein
VPKIAELEAEVKSLLEEAERVQQAEDEAFGCDRRGDERSAELSYKKSRLEKLRAAKEAIEHEAREKAEAANKSEEQVDVAVEEAAARAKPKASAQRSFTDPEAQMMKTNHGFDYAYNAQAVVDEKSQSSSQPRSPTQRPTPTSSSR